MDTSTYYGRYKLACVGIWLFYRSIRAGSTSDNLDAILDRCREIDRYGLGK